MDTYRIGNWLETLNCPPEITHVIRNLYQIRLEDIAYRPKGKGFYFFFWGSFIFILFASAWISTTTEIKENLVLGTLTALAILAGFLINLMIYTGNSENLRTLDHNIAENIARDIRSLLRFQIKTFLFYLFSILYGLLWFVVEDCIRNMIVETLMLASIICSVLFSMILPFQLYEIHHFLLTEIVKEKKRNAFQQLDNIEKNLNKNK